MTQPTHLDTIYTADEAAARLRLSNRALIKIARKYGCCSRFGRDYLFSEADLLAIWEVLRAPEREPKPKTVKAHTSDFRLYESLQKLTAKKKGSGSRRSEESNAKK
ncbi:hypothetical protein GB928_004120 [Shinella curvata]|uniref:Helix-turn-helix domain-containing protein n=1 Tax=Shinella curvata TaxID=1817964 RepID=A0ABT8X9L3_9HYPH|nr:hypothetical protein [Shinella curvata]MCJ8051692.1 hypothetical protein [Shinella curvata]MDO6120361.1 hypothetical protein [Shinella curvata]